MLGVFVSGRGISMYEYLHMEGYVCYIMCWEGCVCASLNVCMGSVCICVDVCFPKYGELPRVGEVNLCGGKNEYEW